ncbi:MAG: hypothetical protein OXI90_08380 [Gammaproteobacteria bacterium]|nr:hypothetical protein [Gammaproteobacteria bacterium]
MEQHQAKTSRVSAIAVEYVSAAGGFVFLAWIGGVPMAVVAIVIAFLLTGCAASVLFDQLSGIRELPGKSRSVIGVAQSSIIGMSIGAGSVWTHEYIDDFGLGIGISLAAVVGVSTALTGTAWRQRWNERQLYRDILSQAEPEN